MTDTTTTCNCATIPPPSFRPDAENKFIEFDPTALSDRLNGDAEIIADILGVFAEDTPERITLLRNAVSQQIPFDAVCQAHTIKGSSSSVGAPMLKHTAEQIESACKTQDFRKAAKLLPHLEEHFAKAQLAITAWLNHIAAAS